MLTPRQEQDHERHLAELVLVIGVAVLILVLANYVGLELAQR